MSYVAVDPHIDHEIDTVHKVDNKSLVMPTLDSAEPNIHSMSNSNTRSRWTIGWKTPTTIVVLYLLAVLIAVCHWIFFHFLDRKRVGHPIAQSYVSAISTAFITAFGAALLASLSTALTQSLWQLLRTHPMRISTIDNLFAITSSPLQLLSWDVLRSAPFICFAAVVSFCISAAMSFPPGALIVVLSPSIQTFNATVPYFSPSYFGNGSYTDEMDNTLFEFDSYHSYAHPGVQVTQAAQQAILSGNYLTSPSPCGQNCSYTLKTSGPSYECANSTYPGANFTAWMSGQYQISDFAHFEVLEDFVYMAGEPQDDPAVPTFRFEISYRNGESPYVNLSCSTYESTYTLNISYTNGVQTIETHIDRGLPLNNTDVYLDESLTSWNGPVLNDSTLLHGENVTIVDIFTRSNLIAIKDTLVYALSGLIPTFRTSSRGVNQAFNTIIRETRLVSLSRTPSPSDGLGGTITEYNITPEGMEELLQNITISMLTLNQTTTSTQVIQTEYVNVYAFAHPLNLLLPYFLSLAVALVVIVAGVRALLINGVSANGGFKQMLCTTSESKMLHRAAEGGCLGGEENVPENLSNLRVLFGELDPVEPSGIRHAGFGFVGEVKPLQKWETYA